MLLEQRMKQLLEDILHTLNQLPDRKVKGKDFTTYDLASRLEKEIDNVDIHYKLIKPTKKDNNDR